MYIGNTPFQGLVGGGNILDASIEGVDLSTSAIAARLGYTPVDPGAATFTANPTISSGTANTVAYLNGSKVVSGSANLTFDGTTLTVGANGSYAIKLRDGSGTAKPVVATSVNDTYFYQVGSGDTHFRNNADSISLFTLTGTGNLGINQPSPTAKLHVLAADAITADLARFQQTNQGNLLIQSQQGNQNIGGANGILFSNSVGSMGWRTNAATGTANMLLDTNGNLGVGVVSPSQKFHVANAGSVVALVENTSSTADARLRAKNTQAYLEFGQDATGGYIQQYGAYPIVFYSNGSERARFNSSGNFGIGTSSPGYKLETYLPDSSGLRTTPADVLAITSYSSSQPYNGYGAGLVFKHSNYNYPTPRVAARIRSVVNDNSVDTYGGSIAFDITATNNSSLAEAMVLNYAGNVGIGTGTPSGKLHLYKPSADLQVNLQADNGYNSFVSYNAYSSGLSFGRNGGNGYFEWRNAGGFGGDSLMTLRNNAGASGRLTVTGEIYTVTGLYNDKEPVDMRVRDVYVAGDPDTYYPIAFALNGNRPTTIHITKHVHNYATWDGWLDFEVTATDRGWGGFEGSYGVSKYAFSSREFVAQVGVSSPVGNYLIVWLRGGGRTYSYTSNTGTTSIQNTTSPYSITLDAYNNVYAAVTVASLPKTLSIAQNQYNYLRLDSSGNLLRPYQAAFSAYKNGNTSFANGDIRLESWTEVFDEGGNFDASTGRFTAPVPGTYVFNMSLMVTNQSSYDTQSRWYKNGSYVAGSNHVFSATYNQVTIPLVTKLAAGDYVEPHIYSNGTGPYVYTDRYSHIHGFML